MEALPSNRGVIKKITELGMMLDKKDFSMNSRNMVYINTFTTMGTARKIHLHTRNRASQIMDQLSSVHSRLF
jgi:hypothetical protein